MNRPPRNINRSAFIIQLALLLSLVALPAGAQQQKRGRSRSQPIVKTQTQAAERARRAKALTLLGETAEEAHSLDDLFYRARLQALAANALFPFDQQRARATFRRAWEAATASDKAEREADAQATGATVDEAEPVTEARDEVLAKTAARDPALASVFVDSLLKDRKRESDTEQNDSVRSTTWREPSAAGARQIALGFELLDKSEVKSAAKIVINVVATEGASAAAMAFLLRLRERDAAAGDGLYYLMLATMDENEATDANMILLLSTPIASPRLMVAVDEYGSLQFRPVATGGSQVEPPPFRPATRKLFFKVAASALLRPASSRSGVNEVQDKAARYFAIGRLLPFFEREAAQFVPELQARASNLLNEFTESRRTSLSSQLDVRQMGATPSTDALRSHFEERERASDQQERDRITTRIVLLAARNRSWDRARRAAAELSDESTRRAANSFIAVNQIADLAHAYADEKEDDFEEIVGFLKSVDVPPLAAAWGYAEAALVAARKKDSQPRVAELLTEAEHYAGRVDANTSMRVAAYGVIASAAARLDRGRAWELLTQLVKAANALADYTGDEISIELRADENQATAIESPFIYTTDLFRLETIFATMAQLDFERALLSARTLEGHVPRVFAQLAIARAALEKK